MTDWRVVEADCIGALREMPDGSVDAIVTDPPYGIGFMGHAWDQPGDHGAVRANGSPSGFASGRPDAGPHVAGGAAALARQMARAQRRGTQRDPGSGAGHARERQNARNGVQSGPTGADNTRHSERGGAMHAGRYDLSPTANRRFQAWCEEWGAEALRVLKPGGYLVAFGSTRTYHRLAAGLEDTGFEIRDTLCWMFGSGFPKSLNIGKAIDAPFHGPAAEDGWITPSAREHAGWGTALKPGYEPITVARKPLIGTVAGNVLEHGTGALNIDACRIAGDVRATQGGLTSGGIMGGTVAGERRDPFEPHDAGRWPANVVLGHTDGCTPAGTRRVRTGAAVRSNAERDVSNTIYGPLQPVVGDDATFGDGDGMETIEAWDCAPDCPIRLLDEQTGELTSGANPTRRGSDKFRDAYGEFKGQEECTPARGADSGGASRFYYCAKTSTAERNAGLDGLPVSDVQPTLTPTSTLHKGRSAGAIVDDHKPARAPSANSHPTVKPIALMRWLIRLVTPPGGTVLDPFTGSGSTGCAAVLEGFEFVGVERQGPVWVAEHPDADDYVAIAEARIGWWAAHPEGVELVDRLAAERVRADVAAAGQLDLLS